jgi:mono/diheme cytochrome c family protein
MPKGSGAGKFFLGLILGLILIPIAVFCFLRFGHLPVAVADQPIPFERQLTHTALDARIDREAPKDSPFGPSEDAFMGGAREYMEHCAFCHGTPSQDAHVGRLMYPHAPQLFKSHRAGVTGVSDDPVGETYWKVANGIRLTGMPAFKDHLSDIQIWQVSLLLKNADQPFPDPVAKILAAHPAADHDDDHDHSAAK